MVLHSLGPHRTTLSSAVLSLSDQERQTTVLESRLFLVLGLPQACSLPVSTQGNTNQASCRSIC